MLTTCESQVQLAHCILHMVNFLPVQATTTTTTAQCSLHTVHCNIELPCHCTQDVGTQNSAASNLPRRGDDASRAARFLHLSQI